MAGQNHPYDESLKRLAQIGAEARKPKGVECCIGGAITWTLLLDEGKTGQWEAECMECGRRWTPIGRAASRELQGMFDAYWQRKNRSDEREAAQQAEIAGLNAERAEVLRLLQAAEEKVKTAEAEVAVKQKELNMETSDRGSVKNMEALGKALIEAAGAAEKERKLRKELSDELADLEYYLGRDTEGMSRENAARDGPVVGKRKPTDEGLRFEEYDNRDVQGTRECWDDSAEGYDEDAAFREAIARSLLGGEGYAGDGEGSSGGSRASHYVVNDSGGSSSFQWDIPSSSPSSTPCPSARGRKGGHVDGATDVGVSGAMSSDFVSGAGTGRTIVSDAEGVVEVEDSDDRSVFVVWYGEKGTRASPSEPKVFRIKSETPFALSDLPRLKEELGGGEGKTEWYDTMISDWSGLWTGLDVGNAGDRVVVMRRDGVRYCHKMPFWEAVVLRQGTLPAEWRFKVVDLTD